MLSKELVAASTIPIVLSLLRVDESYGYEIIQRVVSYPAAELNSSPL